MSERNPWGQQRPSCLASKAVLSAREAIVAVACLGCMPSYQDSSLSMLDTGSRE